MSPPTVPPQNVPPQKVPPQKVSPPTLLYGATLLVRGSSGQELVETEVFVDDGRVATVGRAVTMLPGTRVLELGGGLVAGLVRPGAIGPDLAAPDALARALEKAGVDGFATRLGSVVQGDDADLVVFAPLSGLGAETPIADVPALLARAEVRHLLAGGRLRVQDGEVVAMSDGDGNR